MSANLSRRLAKLEGADDPTTWTDAELRDASADSMRLRAAVTRMDSAQRRAFLPRAFRILGDPAQWPGFDAMTERRQSLLRDAFTAHGRPPLPSEAP